MEEAIQIFPPMVWVWQLWHDTHTSFLHEANNRQQHHTAAFTVLVLGHTLVPNIYPETVQVSSWYGGDRFMLCVYTL